MLNKKMMTQGARILAGSVALVAASASHAVGITVDQLGLSDSQRAALAKSSTYSPALVSPGIAFGSPVGFGLSYGQISAGIGGQTLPSNSLTDRNVDGSAGVSVGLGDAARYVGLESTLNIVSLTNSFGDSGSANFKLHRLVGARTSVAIGTESVLGWGDARASRTSNYGAVTTVVDGPMGLPLAINVGVGNHRFVTAPGQQDDNKVRAFGGLALLASDRVSFILDYAGIDLNAAVSFVPVKKLPLTVTLGYVNLTEQQGLTREFSGAVGYVYRF